jgi:alkylhydroperoxidase family enzyme
MTGSFLEEPPLSPEVQALYDDDLADGGYVWNVSRLWAHQPDTMNGLFHLMSQAFKASGLSFRQRGILVTAAASALGDSYCSLAWGGKLATASDAALAAGILNGSDAALTDQEKAMAAWARKVVKDPERDDARRHREAPRLRARRRPDLRHHGFRRPSPGVLDDQRRARCTA